MNLIADENIDSVLIQWLREQGCDVLSVNESLSSLPDPAILKLAVETKRIVLTADKDFGELVYNSRQHTHGVILLRFDSCGQAELLRMFSSFWPEIQVSAGGLFLVIRNDRLRCRKLPPVE